MHRIATQLPAPVTRCRYLGNTSVTRRIAATSIMFAVGVGGVAVSPLLPIPPLQGFIVSFTRVARVALTPSAGVPGFHRRGWRCFISGAARRARASCKLPFVHDG